MSSSSPDLTPTSSLSEAETPLSSLDSLDEAAGILDNVKDSIKKHQCRWRPCYHVQPSAPSWMNDPCAPFYNPQTGLYHVSYQWNPNGPDWGDIAWGTATSPDMIHWTIEDKPILSPDATFDHKGVFTGCFMPSDNGTLTYAYTSVSQLPMHHTLPHARGSESLSLASSNDGGKTWIKSESNPILPCEPEGLDITGWRDPFVAKWPNMAEALNVHQDTPFGIISGGVRGKTPTTFLYAIDVDDSSKWTYVGPLANFGLNFSPSRWSGDFGINWEVSNFLTLTDENNPSIQRDLVVCGTEGCLRKDSVTAAELTGPSRPIRQQLWFAGDIKSGQPQGYMGPVEMKYKFGGHLDHGNLYAANSFFDPKSEKHIVWGWIGEDDLADELRHSQGWSGMLSMPRELRMITMQHVIGAAVSDLDAITSVQVEADQVGSYTLRTLASQPYQPLIEALRQKEGVQCTQIQDRALESDNDAVTFEASAIRTNQWELDVTLEVSDQARSIGLSIAHDQDFTDASTLLFDQPSETFTLKRPSFTHPNSSALINSSPEVAPHTLFITRNPATGIESKERLRIRAWRDNSVLEVFINERTAISTRLYAADETFGVRFFVEDQADSPTAASESRIVSATLWDGIGV